MKKTLLVILALVMALTLVIGSVSMVSAAKPVDEGYKQLRILSFPSADPSGSGNFYWTINYCRDAFDQSDFTQITALSLNGGDTTFNDDVTASIDWKKGIATFTCNELNLTVTFDTNDVSTYGSGKNTSYNYGGGGDISGFILYDSIQYDVNTTLEYNVEITENHYVAEPEPEISIGNIDYDYQTDPTIYSFDLTDISWQNTTPYRIEILLTDEDPAGGDPYSSIYVPLKGPDSKYPQNFEINLNVDSNTYEYLDNVTLQVMLLDRNLNPITSSDPRWYTWGGEGD